MIHRNHFFGSVETEIRSETLTETHILANFQIRCHIVVLNFEFQQMTKGFTMFFQYFLSKIVFKTVKKISEVFKKSKIRQNMGFG